MVDVLCIGVGEAFQPRYGSASYLVESQTKLLIDCGFGAPPYIFERLRDPDELDLIYLTHFHADHFFGLPPVLHRWSQEGRSKPLHIIGQPGAEERVKKTLELGYPGMLGKLAYELRFTETTDSFQHQELTLTFAPTQHPMLNYAVKVSGPDFVVGFSGDGALTDASEALFSDCELLFLEAFRFDTQVMGHTSATEAVAYSKKVPTLRTLALVHIHREDRDGRLREYQSLGDAVDFTLIIPEPGDVVSTDSELI